MNAWSDETSNLPNPIPVNLKLRNEIKLIAFDEKL